MPTRSHRCTSAGCGVPSWRHDEKLSAGELQAALSNAIVRIMREFYGKGAARSRTMIFDDYVFVVLEDVLTTAEMTLRNGGAGDLVRQCGCASRTS